jgi:hypothetical protein
MFTFALRLPGPFNSGRETGLTPCPGSLGPVPAPTSPVRSLYDSVELRVYVRPALAVNAFPLPGRERVRACPGLGPGVWVEVQSDPLPTAEQIHGGFRQNISEARKGITLSKPLQVRLTVAAVAAQVIEGLK